MINFDRVEIPTDLFPIHAFPPLFKEAWKYKQAEVYFLMSRRGNALDMHLGARGRDKRYIRQAGQALIDEVRDTYPWCQMLIGAAKRQVDINYNLNMGFKVAGRQQYGEGDAIIMVRIWADQ